VIEDAEIELSLALDYKLSLESPVTYRIILNRLPRPTGAQLVHEGIGLSSRRQSGKLERQSAKCKHRHRDTTVVVIGCADSISGAAERGWEAHRCTLGRNCLSELTAAKFASKTACFRRWKSTPIRAHGEINSSSVRSDVIHRREWAWGANLANSVKRTFAYCEFFIVVRIIAWMFHSFDSDPVYPYNQKLSYTRCIRGKVNKRSLTTLGWNLFSWFSLSRYG